MILGEVGQSSPFYGVKGFIPSNSPLAESVGPSWFRSFVQMDISDCVFFEQPKGVNALIQERLDMSTEVHKLEEESSQAGLFFEGR